MFLQKEVFDGIEIIHSPKDIEYEQLLILIPGGGKVIGASRFNTLQNVLLKNKIGSVSINFKGVEGSAGLVEGDSLEGRITTTIKVIDKIKKDYIFKFLSLYGVSMGGSIILGVQDKIKSNGKIIIHTPAAYAKEALNTHFNEQFTTILKTPNSWKSSDSFDLLKSFPNPTLLITHSLDEVIPKEISDAYEQIVIQKNNSRVVTIDGAKHSVWANDELNNEFKTIVIDKIIDFIWNSRMPN
jgi:alpha/beta superfamily hydrolase